MEAIIVLVAFLLLVLFIFAANIMSRGGITKRIFLFCDAICGHFSGGLAHANVLASMLFGGISGASNAEAVGLGAIEIEMMTEKGYKRSYSAAVTAASAILSSIVPPSNIFIVYAVTAGTVSVSAMFIGGIVPAVLLTALLIGLNVYYAKRYNFPKNEKFAGWRYVGKTALQTLPALFMPIIILGGILGGVFTPTESSVVAGVYALVVSAFILRNLTWRDVYEALVESAKMTAVVMFIIAVAAAMGWGHYHHAPTTKDLRMVPVLCAYQDAVHDAVLRAAGHHRHAGGRHPRHPDHRTYSGARCQGLRRGYALLRPVCRHDTDHGPGNPPVGMLLFTTSTVAKIDLSAMYKSILPYALVEIIFCVLLIFAEPVLLFLPRLFGY